MSTLWRSPCDILIILRAFSFTKIMILWFKNMLQSYMIANMKCLYMHGIHVLSCVYLFSSLRNMFLRSSFLGRNEELILSSNHFSRSSILYDYFMWIWNENKVHNVHGEFSTVGHQHGKSARKIYACMKNNRLIIINMIQSNAHMN